MSIISGNNNLYNLILSSIIIAIFSVISLIMNIHEDNITTIKNTISFMGGSYLMSSITQKPLTFFIKSIDPYIPVAICTNKFKKLVNKYNIKYLNISKLSEHNNKCILKYMARLEILMKDDANEQKIKNILFILDYIFTIENDTTTTNIDIHTYINKIDKYLETIQPDVSEIVKNNIFKPYLCNIYKPDKYVQMTAIYLHGDPGTGKTYFVNNMAKILDLPIYEYTRTDCYCEEIGENEPFTTKYANIFTKLIYTAKLNKKNGIILFIDELDTKLKNDSNLITFLLELINKGLFKYIERSINYEINIKNIVIICCGHIKIEDIKYETSIDKNICLKALSSRFLTINFPNITIEYKKNIIKCYINNNYPFINYDKHSEEIDKIIENDNETGIRKLIVDIDYLINKYICDEVFIGTDWEQKIDL